MILYSCVTSYHLLEAIIHKLRVNEDENSILMISKWLKAKYSWYRNLEVMFDKIIVFDADYKYSNNIEEDLKNYFEKLLEDNGLNIKVMDQIHVFGAEHSFGAFIFTQHIENFFWEEGAGALSKKDSMLELFEKAYGTEKARFQYQNHLGDGEAYFVVNRFYNRDFQLQPVYGDNLIHFDISVELEKLREDQLNQLVELFYGKEKIKIGSDNCALILTEHFANLSVMSWNEQELLYKYLIDYFISDKELLFKPHPDDLMYYEYLFKNCRVIRKKFPAELLPYIFEKKPHTVMTSSSTSIYGFRKIYEHCIEFNFDFSHKKEFYKLNRIYVALKYIQSFVNSDENIQIYGVNSSIINNFFKYEAFEISLFEDRGNIFDPSNNTYKCYLIDEIVNPEVFSKYICSFLEKLNSNAMVVFLNSDHKFCFYHPEYKEVWQYLHPINIDIKPIQQHGVTISGPSLLDEKESNIYVYYKERKGKESMFELKRELPNVGITVEAKGFDGAQLKIQLLEGMLEATEKRVMYYINKEKEVKGEK